MSPVSTFHLLGLDVGSTTTSVLVARARVLKNSVTQRMELADAVVVWRSEMVLTPYRGAALDTPAVFALVDSWVAACGVPAVEIRAGSALVTGLAALATNAEALASELQRRYPDALAAVADDPLLESWLAFQGNCAALCRRDPRALFLNLDIGGGTTNWALGRGGEVLRAGWNYAGARHFRFIPGSYTIDAVSSHGVRLLAEIGLRRGHGDTLTPDEVAQVTGYLASSLEALVTGDAARWAYHVKALDGSAKPPSADELAGARIVFSGGVGELFYRPRDGVTPFGDLGSDLAGRLAGSRAIAVRLSTEIPETLGRATVQGLALHQIEVSGASCFIAEPSPLPLRGVPILGNLPGDAAGVAAALRLGAGSARGAVFLVPGLAAGAAGAKAFGLVLRAALAAGDYPATSPLVILLPDNRGKVVGSYASDWGRLPTRLVVVDEIVPRGAKFVSLGQPRHQVIPVSFYGSGGG